MAESTPATEPSKTIDMDKFARSKYNEGLIAAKKRIAQELGVEPDKLEEFAESLKSAEQKRLEEEGRFQEIAEKERQRAEKLEAQIATQNDAIARERFKNALFGKVADPELALKAVAAEQIKFDSDGNIVGMDEIVEGLVNKHPSLKISSGSKPSVGSATSGAGDESESPRGRVEVEERMAEIERLNKLPRKSIHEIAQLQRLRDEVAALKKAE